MPWSIFHHRGHLELRRRAECRFPSGSGVGTAQEATPLATPFADVAARDTAVADVYARYFDAALQELAVGAVMTFGLSDRYTWLQEDFPREDGEPRRPLPFDEELQPKPAYFALEAALASAPEREPIWQLPPG